MTRSFAFSAASATGQLDPVPQARHGFAAFSAALSSSAGLLLARVASEPARCALLAHIARHAAGSGRRPLHLAARAGASIWVELAARLHVHHDETDPSQVAAQLVDALRAHRVTATAARPLPGTWDDAVTREVARLEAGADVVLLTVAGDQSDCSDKLSGLAPRTFDLTTAPDEAGREAFFDAIAKSSQRTIHHNDLVALDAWWEARGPRSFPDPPESSDDLRADADAAVKALWLAGRAWPREQAHRLCGGIGAAITVGTILEDDGWLYVAPRAASRAAQLAQSCTSDVKNAVAEALQDCFAGDALASMRGAELWLSGGTITRAETAYGEALTQARHGLIRAQLTSRWGAAIETTEPHTKGQLYAAGAERALATGDAELAFRWSRAAQARRPSDLSLTLLVGRAAVASGDLVSAAAALEQGAHRAVEPQMRSLFAVEIAELSYVRGDHTRATAEAELALAKSTDAVTRLRARNTVGKLLLATSSWAAADAHFAQDALTASRQDDHTGELRARINRGIALLSRGSHDEARAMFEAVLEEGDTTGDGRACAFALDNLAVVAMWRHEYGIALDRLERSLAIRQRLGDRLATARILANLADLRRKLGLNAHAEHAVAFGRRVLGAGMPTEMSAHFSAVSARLALARGDSALAQREVARAIADGVASSHTEHLGEDHRVATRVALDDGELQRAADSLQRARVLSTTLEGRAEVAVLDAALSLAYGAPQAGLFSQAIALTRAAGEEELLREALMLTYDLQRATGEHSAAAGTLVQAIAVRDAVASSVFGEVRAAYLARPEIARFDAIGALTQSTAAPTLCQVPVTVRGSTDGAARQREVIGDDPTIRALMLAVRRVGPTASTVLIHGESGTGKELVAEALHRASDRSGSPLVTVSCAALVESLLLSELFGHEKGAFTGAVARRRGRFELAEGGTLFLDEIGDISPGTQVALLRVLQERTFERVGGTASVKANVRVVCATHRDLQAMVERGEFREDLYYRLKGFTLEVPPLRSRLGDLARIADDLLARIADERGCEKKLLTTDACELLERHRWPGNIRELDNVLRSVSVFCENASLSAADFAANVPELQRLAPRPPCRTTPTAADPVEGSAGHSEPSDLRDSDDISDFPLPQTEAGPTAMAYAHVRQGSISLADLKRQIERDCIARALAETRGNITRAAALLGMKRPRLSQLVKQYGIATVATEPQ